MEQQYPGPVTRLRALGDCRNETEWPDYLALGLTLEHVDAVVDVAHDALDTGYTDEDPAGWAPIHAWRALGQLRAEGAIPIILDWFTDFEEWDWATEALPDVLGMIGPVAIDRIVAYFGRSNRDLHGDIMAAGALAAIGRRHPEARNACVAALTEQLRRYADTDPERNGFIVHHLIELKAPEAIDLIREAYANEGVDPSICGDIEQVEIAMGLRLLRTSPPKPLNMFQMANEWRRAHPPVRPALSQLLRAPRKIGRNDPCPCGSDKKYKTCCLKAD